jgi:hypothetical protein
MGRIAPRYLGARKVLRSMYTDAHTQLSRYAFRAKSPRIQYVPPEIFAFLTEPALPPVTLSPDQSHVLRHGRQHT